MFPHPLSCLCNFPDLRLFLNMKLLIFFTSYSGYQLFVLVDVSFKKNHSYDPVLFRPPLPVVFNEWVQAKENVISWEMSCLRWLTYHRELVTQVDPVAHSRWSIFNGTKDGWYQSFSSLNVLHFTSLFIWDHAHWKSNVRF